MGSLYSSLVSSLSKRSKDKYCLAVAKQRACSPSHTKHTSYSHCYISLTSILLLSACSVGYIWFIPILDLYRSHRAMHGNTPGQPSKSEPPPLVPPGPPSPLLTKRKKSTKLDYTDDISIGNPSVSTRRSGPGAASQNPGASKKQDGNSTTPPITHTRERRR